MGCPAPMAAIESMAMIWSLELLIPLKYQSKTMSWEYESLLLAYPALEHCFSFFNLLSKT